MLTFWCQNYLALYKRYVNFLLPELLGADIFRLGVDRAGETETIAEGRTQETVYQ